MGSRTQFQKATMFFAAAVVIPLLLGAVITTFHPRGEPETPPPPVLIKSDSEPPVLNGGAGTWEELFQKTGDNPAYWTCFEQRTGHTRAEAEQALAREREGWDLRVRYVSNATDEQAKAAADSQGVPMDESLPVVHVSGFSNTRGAGAGNCEAFFDNRSQVRVALTLPGKEKGDVGEPVVLSHCGNPIGKPETPPASTQPSQPSQPSRPPTKPGKPPTPTGPKPSVPPTVPSKPGKCANQGQYCGTPDSGPEFDPVQSNPQPPTPGYVPGNAERVINQQNQDAATTRNGGDPYRPTPYGTPGTGTGSGVTTPSGQTQTPTGPVTGGTAGTQTPDNNTNTAGQTSSGDPGPPA